MKKYLSILMVLLFIGCIGVYSRSHWNLSLMQSGIDGILKIRTVATGEYDVDMEGAAIPLGDGYILALTHYTNPDKILMQTPFGAFEMDNKVETVKYTVNEIEAFLVGREDDLSLFKCPEIIDPYPIKWGDSDNIQPGDRVMLIGTTYGMSPLLADGIVSSIDFVPPEGAEGINFTNRLLFAPHPDSGDSGTPLISIDSWGNYRIIGIVDQSVGKLGSAIKSNYILETVESLKV